MVIAGLGLMRGQLIAIGITQPNCTLVSSETVASRTGYIGGRPGLALRLESMPTAEASFFSRGDYQIGVAMLMVAGVLFASTT